MSSKKITKNKGIEVVTNKQFEEMKKFGELVVGKQYYIVDVDVYIDRKTIRADSNGVIYVPDATITDLGVTKLADYTLSGNDLLSNYENTTTVTPEYLTDVLDERYASTNVTTNGTTKEVSGLIKIAKSTDIAEGTDWSKAVTPAGLLTRTATKDRIGLVELATDYDVVEAIDNSKAVTPAALLRNKANGVCPLNNDSEVPLGNLPAEIPVNKIMGITYNTTILASNWITNNDTAKGTTYTYPINIAGLPPDACISILPGLSITIAQLEALQESNIQDGGVASSGGQITLIAFNKKPTINIPVRIMTIGRTTAIELTSTSTPSSTKLISSVSVSGDTSNVTSYETTRTYVATISPIDATNQAVTWKSSNTNIAKIISNSYNTGIATFIGTGSVTFTATAADGSGKTGTTASISSTQYVTDIIINGDTSKVTLLGSTRTYTATVLPNDATNKAVTWGVSNSTVASITTDGVVTFKASGSVTITATAKDGSSIIGTSGAITVVQNITAIAINGSTSILRKGSDITATYTTSITPSNATNTAVSWSTSDALIATINSSGVATFYKPGVVNIIATSNDGSGIVGKLTVNIKQLVTDIIISGTSSIIGETTVIPNEIFRYTATITPDNTSNSTTTWSINNTNIAYITTTYGNSVNTNDKVAWVTAIKTGSFILTAKATDGSGIVCNYPVTVNLYDKV